MKNMVWKLSAAAVLVAVFALMVGCKRSAPPPPGPTTPATVPQLEGRIRISGAWALYPMMARWAEEFQKLHPGVRIDVSAGGAGKGMADALAGLVEIGMVSREITPAEVQKGAAYAAVVGDAVFPTISALNPLLKTDLAARGVRKQALVDLWIGGKPLTWGEICGADSAEKVSLYTRSDSCGAAETWAVYLGKKKQEDLKGVGVYGDPGVAEAVKNDRWGLGYNNLNFAFNAKTGQLVEGVAVLPVDLNEDGKIGEGERLTTMAEAIEAIRKGVYPSPPARTLYLVTKTQFQGVTAVFLRWILTDGQKLAPEAGYLGLSPEQLADALKTIPAN